MRYIFKRKYWFPKNEYYGKGFGDVTIGKILVSLVITMILVLIIWITDAPVFYPVTK